MQILTARDAVQESCQMKTGMHAAANILGPIQTGTNGTGTSIPIPMTTRVPNIRNVKRMKSAIEQQASRKRATPAALEWGQERNSRPFTVGEMTVTGTSDGIQDSQSQDTVPRSRPKPMPACRLCRRQGHTVYRCPTLEKYAGSLLPIRRSSSKNV